VNNIVKYTPPAENEAFLTVADMARAVRKRLWMVILLPLLAVGAAVGASLLQPPVYEATATVVVSPMEGANRQENISNKISGLQFLAHEMAVMGLNRPNWLTFASRDLHRRRETRAAAAATSATSVGSQAYAKQVMSARG